MNKDIRINWNMGMELLPETFIHLENQLAEYRMMLRKVQASKQFGLIPDMPFKVLVSIDGGSLALNGVECHALLQNGDIVDIKRDDGFNISIPNRSDILYLAVWTADKELEYEIDDVPLLRNGSQFGFFTLNELTGKMPIAKMVKHGDGWKLQEDYVVPVVSLESSAVLVEAARVLIQLAKQVRACEQFVTLRNYEVMGVWIEEMECIDKSQNPRDFAVLCRRFARLLASSVMTEPVKFAEYNPYDAQLFFKDMLAFLTKANEILSTIVLEEPEEKPDETPEIIEECPIL